MNREPDPSVTQQVKFDAVCIRIEQAWRQQQRPAIESFLQELREDERALLLPQLLLLELEHLEESDIAPNLDDYLNRFTDEQTIVREAFWEHAKAIGGRSACRARGCADRSLQAAGAGLHGRIAAPGSPQGRLRLFRSRTKPPR